MTAERILSVLTDSLIEVGRKLQNSNYEHEIYAIERSTDGARFRSYHFVTSSEELLLDRLLQRASRGDVVYDVGANVGHYSLPLAANDCVVYAFEPDPTAFERLEKNISANDGVEITTFDYGLSNAEDTLTFYVSSLSTRSSFSRGNATTGGAQVTRTKDVTVTSIDTLVFSQGLQPPDHVKIDVEGHGMRVLQGATRTLKEHRPVIYLERHDADTHTTTESEESLRSFVQGTEYDVRALDRRYWIINPA